MNETFFITLLLGSLMTAFPLFLAGFGEMLSEEAGVLNLGLEGMMLVGAFFSFYLVHETQNYALGFVGGALAGVSLAFVMVVFCVWRTVDQVVLGLALTFVAQGITSLAHHVHFAKIYPRLTPMEDFSIPFFSDLPIVGELFQTSVFTCLCVCFMGIFICFYRKSILKHQLVAAGSNPKALDVFGVNVFALRTMVVLFTGAMAGLAGSYMSLVSTGLFVPHMTNGAGFIAIILAMLAQGKILWLILGALVFGLSLSINTALQLLNVTVPTDIAHMLPFILIVFVLVVFRRHVSVPKVLGQPYQRTQR